MTTGELDASDRGASDGAVFRADGVRGGDVCGGGVRGGDGAAGCAGGVRGGVADEPRTPRRIALVGTADTGLDFLLGDFRDAYGAYSMLAGCELPEFERVVLGADAVAGDRTGTGAVAADMFGSVVLALDGPQEPDAGTLDVLASRMEPECRLHVILDAPGLDPHAVDGTARTLAGLCTRCGFLWAGGVAFAGGRPFDALRHSPRMGLLRRPFSEVMDMLVGSVRMGCSVRRAQELGGADVRGFDELGLVRATPALPAWLWTKILKKWDKQL